MSNQNKGQKKYCAALLILLLTLTSNSYGSGTKDSPEGAIAKEQLISAKSPSTRQTDSTTVGILDDQLGTIAIPEKAGRIFNDLYYRNESEIYRILNENPYLLWQTIGLVADALPALRLMAVQNGQLRLDAPTYSRANGLYEEFRSLAGPQLTADLEEAKSYVDKRTKKKSSGQVLIDLDGK